MRPTVSGYSQSSADAVSSARILACGCTAEYEAAAAIAEPGKRLSNVASLVRASVATIATANATTAVAARRRKRRGNSGGAARTAASASAATAVPAIAAQAW